MKIRRILNNLITPLLTLAIIISVVFSVLMWINPSHYENNIQKSSNSTASKNNLTTRPISSIYSPTQLVENKNGKQNLLINPSVNMINEIRNELVRSRDFKLRDVGQINSQKGLQLLNRDNSLVLSYTNSVTLSLIQKVFNSRFDINNNNRIDRIVLPLNKRGIMYLFYGAKSRVYQLNFKNNDLNKINQILNDKRIEKNQVTFKYYNHNYDISVDGKINLPQYSYLITNQAQNYYVLRLMGDAQNINVKKKRNLTAYNDQSAKQIIFHDNGNVNFIDDQANVNNRGLSNILNQNYQRLLDSGIILDNMHFFDFNEKQHQYDYRMYVEGFPIFSNDNAGLFRIKIINGLSYRMNFSLKTLQIPTPTTNHQYQLPATQTVINNLVSRGYKKSKIQNIDIGYRWEYTKNSKLVVKLVPSWYIKINGQWLNYNELLER